MLNPRSIRELLLRRTPELEKVSPEPNLLYVRLVTALRYYLLYRVLLLALLVLPQPHQRKTTTPQQLHLVETVRKTVAEHLHLLPTQIVRILLLTLPLQINTLQRIVTVPRHQFARTLSLTVVLLRRRFVLKNLVLLP